MKFEKVRGDQAQMLACKEQECGETNLQLLDAGNVPAIGVTIGRLRARCPKGHISDWIFTNPVTIRPVADDR